MAAFLAGTLRFTDIAALNSQVMEKTLPGEPASVEEVLEIDRTARASARLLLQSFAL